ncbi:DUF3861 domain-containing protein [Ferrovibrio sp.]|uniref:DUF3861 domain-containing protein n=1 Tax=Ferrovibrio sp. TaxID=1917215 RepID=UPI00311F5001
MKRGHRYRVTVEHLATPQGDGETSPPLSFEAVNHDDVLGIARRITAGGAYAPDESAALAVGLKLFTEVMLAHRDDPLFGELQPAMRQFIGRLKERSRAATAAG